MSSEDALDLQQPECSGTLRGQGAELFWLFPCPPCHLSGKSRPGNSKDVGSGHPELAPLACDLHSPMGPHTQKGPHLCSPCLDMTNNFLNKGSHMFVLCPTLSFFTSSCKLGSWSLAPSEMLMRKERYPPSFSFLPYQIHKQIILFFLPTCFLLPSISLPHNSCPLDQVTGLEPRSRVVFQ